MAKGRKVKLKGKINTDTIKSYSPSISPSIMDTFGSKQLKDFNKLDAETRVDLLSAEFSHKISPIIGVKIAESMIEGIRIAREDIYKKYVAPIDAEDDIVAREEKTEELLTYLRIEHLFYQKLQNERKKQEEEKADEQA